MRFIWILKLQKNNRFLLASQAEKDEPDDDILKGMRFLCAEDNALNAEILTELLKMECATCSVFEMVKSSGGV